MAHCQSSKIVQKYTYFFISTGVGLGGSWDRTWPQARGLVTPVLQLHLVLTGKSAKRLPKFKIPSGKIFIYFPVSAIGIVLPPDCIFNIVSESLTIKKTF